MDVNIHRAKRIKIKRGKILGNCHTLMLEIYTESGDPTEIDYIRPCDCVTIFSDKKLELKEGEESIS